MAESRDVKVFGVSMKIISLATLTFQNSALILIMHYSRIMPETAGGRYFTSTAVLLNEIIKLGICLIVAWSDRREIDGPQPLMVSLQSLYADVFRQDSWKLAIPACLYTLQNSLQYVAVSNLDAATFQVTYQLKILTTALFSVTMLNRTLSPRKWLSLLLLTAGVAVVQLPPPAPADSAHKLEKRSATYEGIHADTSLEAVMNRSLGLTAVVIACTISGLAGVYFEKVLKGTSASLWVRNVQLSFYSLFPAFFIGVWWKDGYEISQKGFFNGYNSVVWTAILFQAAGGIVVALCVNFADNIAKNFATSISIIISCVASIYFFDFVMTLNFIIGASLVTFATWLYSKPDAPSGQPAYTQLQNVSVENNNSDRKDGYPSEPNSDPKRAD